MLSVGAAISTASEPYSRINRARFGGSSEFPSLLLFPDFVGHSSGNRSKETVSVSSCWSAVGEGEANSKFCSRGESESLIVDKRSRARPSRSSARAPSSAFLRSRFNVIVATRNIDQRFPEKRWESDMEHATLLVEYMHVFIPSEVLSCFNVDK